MLMKYVHCILFLFVCTVVFAFEPYYHSVKAQNGDGVYSLLRRYKLLDHSCNKTKFLELNNLDVKDYLKAGKTYFLPIKIFEYNGLSIRTTIGIDNWDQAVRIKEYNEKILKDNLRKTKYEDSKILWVPHHELDCVNTLTGEEQLALTDVKPEVRKKGTYRQVDLFGDDHKMVEIKSSELENQIFYLVAGHGGPDPGAMCEKECSNSLCEDEYAYDVVLRLARYLMSYGATVHVVIHDKNDGIRNDKYLECDYDERCLGEKIPKDQKLRLRQRASAINELYSKYKKKGVKNQVAIMVHIDSYLNSSHKVDAYFYHHKSSKSSKKLAASLQKTFKEKYNHFQKNRGYKGTIKTRNLYMLNNTLPTSVYVELANIQNAYDRKRIVLDTNREALAKWMFEGLTDIQL